MEIVQDKMRNQKSAIIFGSTGLVGSYLLRLLCESNNYAKVISFTRKPCGYSHYKLSERITDLGDTKSIAAEITGDDLFCCLGTTIKKAGSKENFEKIDLDLPVQLADIADKNKMQSFTVISSVGANAKSSNFYLHTKGQMEEKVTNTAIPKTCIVRPSMLLGPRGEFRFGEAAGKLFMKALNPLMFGKFKKYRGIHAETVALAMLALALKSTEGANIYESDKLQRIAINFKME